MARLSKFQTIINDRLQKISDELDNRNLSELTTPELFAFFQATAKLREKADEEIDETQLTYEQMVKRRSKA
jgi:predicted lipid-binding transport protein (Tim44 family)